MQLFSMATTKTRLLTYWDSMNIASKITSLTGANKISIGENVYKSLDHKTQREFHELSMPDNRWKYINYGTDRPYKVYTLNT